MTVWAIADLHLSFGISGKKMDIFGKEWENWTERVHEHWSSSVSPNDLVLIPGDISWAMDLDQVKPDLEWIHGLPGTKVMIRGNHDYWWSAISKVRKHLPPSIHVIQNDAFQWNEYSIGGARLWDTPEYNFDACFKPSANPLPVEDVEAEEKVFQRELGRLEASLKKLNPNAKKRIAMTHYPPIGADLKDSRASVILEKYNVDLCAFGHLHNVKAGTLPFGEKNGVHYFLCACDYLHCSPLKICD